MLNVQRREPNDESKPTAAMICMIFTNADPRYAGRLDDKQGGDTIVTMERVREAIAFNAELADESTTSEQMGLLLRPTRGGEHEERAEDLDSSQGVRDHLVAYHLAPAISLGPPPFFQSAGRGDVLFWAKKEGPTVAIWESLSEQEKDCWLEESSTMHDWVVWCKSKKGAEEIRSFFLVPFCIICSLHLMAV